jgi:uncharacterized FAD-dependent dehydrogenase
MLRVTELRLPLDHPEPALRQALLARLGIAPARLRGFSVFRRGHDARKKHAIQLVYTIDAEVEDEATLLARDPRLSPTPDMRWQPVASAPPGFVERPLVIGAGPCGLMAALALARMGFRPIILDRGKVVRERTKDTWALWRRGVLTPESNVQFGEGGAGTFSDGKLYSQIKDRLHHGRHVLEEFVAAGAPEEILTLSKPHIGTFRLVHMVEQIRATIEALGGEYRWSTRVADLLIEQAPDGTRQIAGVETAEGERIAARHVVLAVGHSSRDTFAMLHARGVAVEAKPLSIGVRIEHPQGLIDRARFGPFAGNKTLGAADYKLVHHARNGRGVYSFCMCPGGTVVAAASEPGRLVTNGMSQYSRNERNANSAIVVGVTPADFGAEGPLAGIAFQRHWEERAFIEGGSDWRAPAQRVGDFLAGRPSTTLGEVIPSYRPGVRPADLSRCLPDFAVAAMREALPAFALDIAGFAMEDAVMTGVETRTSSPVRIGRGANFASLNTRGLYPAGEGAGYAGGILSAGVDGLRVADAVGCGLAGAELPGERRWRGGESQGWG